MRKAPKNPDFAGIGPDRTFGARYPPLCGYLRPQGLNVHKAPSGAISGA
jgi:hypothetical protein